EKGTSGFPPPISIEGGKPQISVKVRTARFFHIAFLHATTARAAARQREFLALSGKALQFTTRRKMTRPPAAYELGRN
ncbi:MAG: hypothetical protein C4334_11660, partial [Pyrinomonas sp.]